MKDSKFLCILLIAVLCCVCGRAAIIDITERSSDVVYASTEIPSDSLDVTSQNYFDLGSFLNDHHMTILNHGPYWEGAGDTPVELYLETEQGYRLRIISYGDSTPVFAWEYDDTDEGFYEIDFTDAGDRNSAAISTRYDGITLGPKSVETLVQIGKRLPELEKGVCPFSQTGILHFAVYDGDFIGHDESDTLTYDYELDFGP